MKKKKTLLFISFVLILALTTVFVACDDKEDNNPVSIRLTEDMTAEDILNLLPQIENMTLEFVCENYPYNYTYRMKISKQGIILKYIYDTSEFISVACVLNDKIVYIDYSHENWYKSEEAITENNQQYNEFVSQINYIKKCFEDGNDWRVEDGKLIIVEPNSTEPVNHELTFKDFNCTEMNFDYYLSMDIPMIEDND